MDSGSGCVMSGHVTMVQTDHEYYWFECVCGQTGSKFYRFMGVECAEQDAAYHLDQVSDRRKREEA